MFISHYTTVSVSFQPKDGLSSYLLSFSNALLPSHTPRPFSEMEASNMYMQPPSISQEILRKNLQGQVQLVSLTVYIFSNSQIFKTAF